MKARQINAAAFFARPAPGYEPLAVTNPLSQDQAELARRKAAAPLLASKPQQAADFGLFGDSAAQTDLIDMSRRAKR